MTIEEANEEKKEKRPIIVYLSAITAFIITIIVCGVSWIIEFFKRKK